MNHTVHFRHSNVNNCIDKTLFGSLFFLFFNILSGNKMSSVKRQLSVKSLGEKCQAMRELEKGLANKDVAEKYGVPKNTISTWIKSKSKYFAAPEQSSNKRKKLITNELTTYATAFAKIRIICLILTENEITITVKISIYFLSPFARITKVNTEVNAV